VTAWRDVYGILLSFRCARTAGWIETSTADFLWTNNVSGLDADGPSAPEPAGSGTRRTRKCSSNRPRCISSCNRRRVLTGIRILWIFVTLDDAPATFDRTISKFKKFKFHNILCDDIDDIPVRRAIAWYGHLRIDALLIVFYSTPHQSLCIIL